MAAPHTQAEIEKKIRDYLFREVRKQPVTPSALTKYAISTNTKLSVKDVEDGLSSLTGETFDGKVVLQRIPCAFDCCVPISPEGVRCKTQLYESNLAHYNDRVFTGVAFCIMFGLLLIANWKGWIPLLPTVMFMAGAGVMLLALFIARKIANPLYLLWMSVKKIKGYRWWLALLIVAVLGICVVILFQGVVGIVSATVSIISTAASIIGLSKGSPSTSKEPRAKPSASRR